MKCITALSQKGGSSKTTTALHIAVAAELDGFSVAILDMDQQGTAERWGEWRKEKPPVVVSAKATTLERRLEQARAAGADLVVIDTPPLAQSEAREAARVADMILIPCRPAAFDLDAIRLTSGLARDSGKPAFVMVNAGPPNGTAIYTDVAAVVAGLGMEICPHRFSERAAFRHSVGQGLTAQEAEPQGKAAAEVAAMWEWLAGRLQMRQSRSKAA